MGSRADNYKARAQHPAARRSCDTVISGDMRLTQPYAHTQVYIQAACAGRLRSHLPQSSLLFAQCSSLGCSATSRPVPVALMYCNCCVAVLARGISRSVHITQGLPGAAPAPQRSGGRQPPQPPRGRQGRRTRRQRRRHGLVPQHARPDRAVGQRAIVHAEDGRRRHPACQPRQPPQQEAGD